MTRKDVASHGSVRPPILVDAQLSRTCKREGRRYTRRVGVSSRARDGTKGKRKKRREVRCAHWLGAHLRRGRSGLDTTVWSRKERVTTSASEFRMLRSLQCQCSFISNIRAAFLIRKQFFYRRPRCNQSTSWPSNLGNRAATSDHFSSPLTMFATAWAISSRLARTCSVVSRSRSVNVLSLTDWKSTVMPRGVPSSSLRFDVLVFNWDCREINHSQHSACR
jgi:hypothetical protein